MSARLTQKTPEKLELPRVVGTREQVIDGPAAVLENRGERIAPCRPEGVVGRLVHGSPNESHRGGKRKPVSTFHGLRNVDAAELEQWRRDIEVGGRDGRASRPRGPSSASASAVECGSTRSSAKRGVFPSGRPGTARAGGAATSPRPPGRTRATLDPSSSGPPPEKPCPYLLSYLHAAKRVSFSAPRREPVALRSQSSGRSGLPAASRDRTTRRLLIARGS